VLQCVEVCCSVVQCVEFGSRSRVSRCVTVWCRVLSLGVGVVCREFVAVCRGVLHCVAVYYIVLHCNSVRCSAMQ